MLRAPLAAAAAAVRRPAPAGTQRTATVVLAAAGDVHLTLPDGSKLTMQQPKALIVGCSADADIRLACEGLAARHARLEAKGGRLLCTALAAAEPGSLLSPTGVWLDGVELRPDTAYMVAPGTTLAFGTPDTTVGVQFEESGGGGGMADLLLQGMLAGASEEVRRQFERQS